MKLGWAALLASCSWLGCSHPETPPPRPVAVRCAPVVQGALEDARWLRGTVVASPERQAVVAPQVAGRLVAVVVREGEAVARGAMLARVDDRPLREALAQARAQLAQAQATARLAETSLARVAHLHARGISARQQVEDAQARRAETAATVEAVRSAAALAARNLGLASVRSPLAGVVVRVLRQRGELVDGTPATSVVEVADPTSLELLASAAPADLVRLRAGQRAEVRFEALPGTVFPASVRSVSPAVDPATGIGTARLGLTASGLRPPFGLFGTARVVVGTRERVSYVPPAALRTSASGRPEVAVCAGGKARLRTVEVGARGSAGVEILRGLTPGERVVVENLVGLADEASTTEIP